MPETVTKYRVFIASPSDLNDERQAIDEVIRELNLTYGQQNNLVIELIKWETHSASGTSGSSTQELISKDIGDSYDLFIGMMWLKFGTPTKSSGSGTEEEFKIAYQRFQKSPETLQLLFYFKSTPPLNIQDIVPSELEKINNFKNKIGQENVLYWHFNSTNELQGFLRIHIPRRLSELVDKSHINEEKDVLVINDSHINPEEDLGLLDLIDISETKFETSTNAIYNITEATEWIGVKMNEKTEEINRISRANLQPNIKQLRRVFKLTAQSMNEYASRISVEIPIFFENYEDGIKAFSDIINLADDFFDKDNIEELIELKESIISMHDGINGSLDGMEGFYQSVVELPRIDKEINRAKRNIASKLEQLNSGLKTSLELATELSTSISEKITRIEITFASKGA